MGRHPLAATAVAGTLIVSLLGCVEPIEDGDDEPPVEEDGTEQPPDTDEPEPEPDEPEPDGEDEEDEPSDTETDVEVDGDPDAPIATPDAEPEEPADLVDAIEEAVLTRGTANYEATAMLAGVRRATATGSYAFHSEDEIDFSVDLDMRNRAGQDQSAQAVAVGDDFYLYPPTHDGMPAGTEWIKRSRADFEDPPEPRALYSESIRSIAGIRDWSIIAGASELVPAGGRTVDGERARGYRATVDVLDGMDHVGGTGGSWRVLQDLYAQGVRDITFTVWINEEYLPLAIVVQMDSDEGPGTADLLFTDWGTDVGFTLPPDDVVWERS